MTDKEFKTKFDTLHPHPYSRGGLKVAKRMSQAPSGFAFMSQDGGGMIIVFKDNKFKRVKYGQEMDI